MAYVCLCFISYTGWGCSLAWWAKAFGDREDIADILFTDKYTTLNGAELPGLHFNMARYNAGACSWNTFNNKSMSVSPNMLPERQMEGFWLDPTSSDPTSSSWDWSVDKNQRDMLGKAKDRGAGTFELFSNSPMWWMLVNGNPSGSQTGHTDNLRTDQQENFITYMTTIASHAASEWGINFDYIEMFNEPMSNWWKYDNNQEGCHFDTTTQSAIINKLGAIDAMKGKIRRELKHSCH